MSGDDASEPPTRADDQPGPLRALARRSGLGWVRRIPMRFSYYLAPRIGSWWRRWKLRFLNPHVTIELGEGIYFGPGFSLYAPFGGTFRVGDGVEFRRGFRCELADRSTEVTIGKGTRFTFDSVIQCGSRIEVGERCMFGQSSMIADGNHRFRDLDKPMLEQGYDRRPIRLEDDVTTTTKCTIMASIGTRTFVGANSVVSRDLPPYVVAVGAPARVIDYFGPPGSEPPEFRASSSETRGATASPDRDAAPASSQAERK